MEACHGHVEVVKLLLLAHCTRSCLPHPVERPPRQLHRDPVQLYPAVRSEHAAGHSKTGSRCNCCGLLLGGVHVQQPRDGWT
jgi:hypothetical protein